ncbi:hypothetical protein [Gandjariella thermophila]|uniref:Uncharacterized protein n=1 Tax=Gandjariella thermophila TaxID=1931992 RepID=A0A4D4JAE5_9PSEU|nr:hypothetical protein [Gandjariella thermophila]GDY31980.1 hypothetical protein GTS_36130 [Gandjariella thermophila]
MVSSARRAELLLDPEVTDESEHELVATFGAMGFHAESRRKLPHRGAAELDWLVLAALPLHAFLSGLGSAAVKDVYRAVKTVARRATGRRKTETGHRVPLILQDSESKLQIVLEDDLPVEAYHQLVALDLTSYRLGRLRYDRQRGTWRSERDEAAG